MLRTVEPSNGVAEEAGSAAIASPSAASSGNDALALRKTRRSKAHLWIGTHWRWHGIVAKLRQPFARSREGGFLRRIDFLLDDRAQVPFSHGEVVTSL